MGTDENNGQIQRLMELKRRIESTRSERERLQGELDALNKRAIEEFGTADRVQLRDKADKLSEEARKLEKKVDEGIRELEKEIGG